MSDLKKQASIVKQNLYYHFADSCGNWIIPDDMKFLNEVLNDIMKLCNLANVVSDEPQTTTSNITHVSNAVCDFCGKKEATICATCLEIAMKTTEPNQNETNCN